jgi:sulfate transport system ATP-binding protein
MSIRLEHLTKRYGENAVVNGVSLEIATGELFVLLGPSGSGKSTLLRMIAGLSEVDGGKVFLFGRDVTTLSPKHRGIGFVFQHYALFRHMTVADNVEFSLRVARVPREERRRRREELLELVGLSGFGGRRPQQLSGGQRQRVAIARALANRAPVLLLDEPFGALDAKIRVELRQTIRRVQRDLGVTTVFVTHDQEEAFELGDRIAVLNFGRLLEVGEPEELYLRPQTPFVATFLGAANLMVGQSTPRGLTLGAVEIRLRTEAAVDDGRRRVEVLFRPEDVEVAPTREELGSLPLGTGTVLHTTYLGSFERLRLELPRPAGVRGVSPVTPFGADYLWVDASRSQHETRRFPLEPGGHAWLGLRRVHPLAHPGLRFLVLPDTSPESASAVRLGEELARSIHARVTIVADDGRRELGPGIAAGDGAVQAATTATTSSAGPALAMRGAVSPDQFGAAARERYDVVVLGLPARLRAREAARLLVAGDHHLLLVPAAAALPTRFLICVAVGEPGKEDVLFASRLLRQLGAQATVLTVLSERDADEPVPEHVRRFLDRSASTLAGAGSSATTRVRHGAPLREILAEIAEGGHDLLVVGAPLPDVTGRSSQGGLVGDLLSAPPPCPVLIVRARAEH